MKRKRKVDNLHKKCSCETFLLGYFSSSWLVAWFQIQVSYKWTDYCLSVYCAVEREQWQSEQLIRSNDFQNEKFNRKQDNYMEHIS